jgi:hypothetical protein
MRYLIYCAGDVDESFQKLDFDVNEMEPTIISAGGRAVSRRIILSYFVGPYAHVTTRTTADSGLHDQPAHSVEVI